MDPFIAAVFGFEERKEVILGRIRLDIYPIILVAKTIYYLQRNDVLVLYGYPDISIAGTTREHRQEHSFRRFSRENCKQISEETFFSNLTKRL